MSTNLKYKQVVNVSRRTWDVEAYEKRARDRAKNSGNQNSTDDEKRKEAVAAVEDGNDQHQQQQQQEEEEFVHAASGATGPRASKRAFLKARTSKIKSLDDKIGSVEMVNPEAMATTKAVIVESDYSSKDTPAVTKMGVGWHCRVCDCFLKDSLTYLDHINGRKHQRNLGYSMRVERSTKDQVANRLEALVKAKDRCKKMNNDFDGEEEEEEDYNAIVQQKDQELKRRKEERKRERKERKKKKKKKEKTMALAESSGGNNDETLQTSTADDETKGDTTAESVAAQEQEDGLMNGLDPNIAAMMGFSGFGGGNKNR